MRRPSTGPVASCSAPTSATRASPSSRSTAPATGTRPTGRARRRGDADSVIAWQLARTSSYAARVGAVPRTTRHGSGTRRTLRRVCRGARRRRCRRHGRRGARARVASALRRPRRPDSRTAARGIPRRADSPATRARLAAALARSWVYGNDAARGAPFAVEAVELAEQTHDPTVLADALDGQLAASWGPDDLSERLHITARLQDVAAHVDDVRTRMDAHLWRLTTALETLDVTGMHRQLSALDLLADETRSPLVRYFAMTRRAMHATLTDDLHPARRAGRGRLRSRHRHRGPGRVRRLPRAARRDRPARR